ncbi:MAG: hypothetical protein ACRC2R_04245 [Xenococcaceae cyanobacterium]
MSTVNLIWHDYLILTSLFACVAGLWLLSGNKQAQPNELDDTEETLFKMTFAYWLVYCVAVGVLKLDLPQEWQIVQSVKLTAIFSFLLTCACILSLPLHKLTVRRIAE